MSNKGIGASTHKHSSVTPRVQQRSDCCPVEQALSEQLFELLRILKDVTPVYFSGYPPTGAAITTTYHLTSTTVRR